MIEHNNNGLDAFLHSVEELKARRLRREIIHRIILLLLTIAAVGTGIILAWSLP